MTTTPWRLTIEFNDKVAGLDCPDWATVVAGAERFLTKILKPAEAEMAVELMTALPAERRGLLTLGGATWAIRVCAPLTLDVPFKPGDKLFSQP